MKVYLPQDQVFWYVNKRDIKPLNQNLSADVVVVGGGIAGLTAAQSFMEKGCQVVLLEKNFCGSGASGKSSGFITPNAELSLSDLAGKWGMDQAKKIWEFTTSGVFHIKNNIKEFNLDCDYKEMDSLVVANSKRGFKSVVQAEYDARKEAGYESQLFLKDQAPQVIGSNEYYGAILYDGTFGIHAYRYCQGLKEILKEKGVQVFEETPAINITDNNVTTPNGSIKAKHVIVCMDWYTATIPEMWDKVYRVQNYLMLSAPLSDAQVSQLFPKDPYLVWDTDLVYQFYRLTPDNRLMLGGAPLFDTYLTPEKHNNARAITKLVTYFERKFPQLSIQWEYVWPGLIGVSKDVFPIAGFDKNKSSIYYICGVTGLHWGSALGKYSAERIIDNNTSFDHCFSPYRSVPLGKWANYVMGTRASFALSNFFAVGSI